MQFAITHMWLNRVVGAGVRLAARPTFAQTFVQSNRIAQPLMRNAFMLNQSRNVVLRPRPGQKKEERSVFVGVAYLVSMVVGMFGLAWLGYPLYRMFCQGTGLGGTTQVHRDYAPPPSDDEETSKRLISVDFTATVGAQLPWEFKPAQKRVIVTPGETALAFFRARNLSPNPIIGMAVYHVMPPEAGIYFNKVQCFCFDEQLINPGEEVDMPVFFFLDPELMDDPRLANVNNITLSYIFFESKSDIPEEYKDLAIAKKTEKPVPSLAI